MNHYTAEQQWIPLKKSYTLLHNNNKPALVEESDWDQQHSQWRFNSKIESIYDQNNEIRERRYFKGNDDKWVANLKTTYSQQPDGSSTFIKWAWENGKWQEQERDITEWDKSKQQKTSVIMRWNVQQNVWENYQRNDVHYAENNTIVTSDIFSHWDEKTQQWRTISANHYTFDKNGRISQKESTSPSKMGPESQRITYQYDDAGNTTEELVQQRFDAKESTWRDITKIRYSYDLSLRKEEITDKDNIADEELIPMVNALIQKDIYYMENQTLSLKEQVRFSYSKPPQNTENAPIKRYFRSNSDLHKQKSDKPTYLYDEITEQEALSNNQVAYFIGYYRNDVLLRYEKVYNGNTLLYKEIEQPKK